MNLIFSAAPGQRSGTHWQPSACLLNPRYGRCGEQDLEPDVSANRQVSKLFWSRYLRSLGRVTKFHKR